MPIKMKEIYKNIITMLVTIAVILLSLEIFLRAFVMNPPLKDDSSGMHIILNNSERVWALKPNNEGITANAYYKINSLGFRDYEYAKKKPANTFRIASVGASITFGKGVVLEDTYSKQLERKLNSISGKKIEVLNFGVYAYNTKQMYWAIKEQILEFEPDLIIIQYTLRSPAVLDESLIKNWTAQGLTGKKDEETNNLKSFLTNHVYVYRWFARAYLVYNTAVKDKALDFFEESVNLHNQSSDEWKNVAKSFDDMARISSGRKVPIVIFVQPNIYRLDDYPLLNIHSQVIQAARKAGLHAYELYPYFKDRDAEELWIDKFEERHPNKKGHEIIADGMMDTLVKEGLVPVK